MTVHELVRDLRAEQAAVSRYSDRCQLFFEREDRAKRRGDPDSAQVFHDIARHLGHAAYAEIRNPEPAR